LYASVKLLLYVAGVLIGLLVLKWVADFVKERSSRQQIAKDRKQGRKKHESDYEGVNFSDDESGDDESGLVTQPIELTTINKRKKQQAVRNSLKSFNSAADSESDEET
jgi:hypothetical protein